MKRLSLSILLILLVLAGLSLSDSPASRSLHAWWRGVSTSLPGTTTGSTESHKCRQGTAITYSTRKCPKGSVEEAMGAGTVNVINMPAAATPPASAASLPTARDLLGSKPNEPTLYEQQIERATK